ncbi:MAG: RDD family protein [Deltaproteobacteria bacterium]|nr:RDD family protein [Deltaproteobacteria bacterium]
MKCKRCLAQVPDDMNACPNCGQDLSSLRQLLKNFYEQEPVPSEDQGHKPSGPKGTKKKESPREGKGPRVVIDSGPLRDDPGFLLSDTPSAEVPPGEEMQTETWEWPSRGGFWIRSVAFAIDHLILLFTLAIFLVVGFLAVELGAKGGREIFFLQKARLVLPILLPLGVVLVLGYFSFFHAAWGQTIGKMIFGLRVVQIDGQPVSFSRALTRTLGYALSAIPFFLGFFWVGFTASKRSWHDAIAGTMVVREE